MPFSRSLVTRKWRKQEVRVVETGKMGIAEMPEGWMLGSSMRR